MTSQKVHVVDFSQCRDDYYKSFGIILNAAQLCAIDVDGRKKCRRVQYAFLKSSLFFHF